MVLGQSELALAIFSIFRSSKAPTAQTWTRSAGVSNVGMANKSCNVGDLGDEVAVVAERKKHRRAQVRKAQMCVPPGFSPKLFPSCLC